MNILNSLSSSVPLADVIVAGAGGAVLLFWVIGILLSIFWIWMLIDCLTSSLTGTEKLIWFLVILFLHVLGALLYFFLARGSGRGGITTA